MNQTLSCSLNGNTLGQIGLISSLAFVSPDNCVASNWILANVPSENASEAFLTIKTQLHTITDTKHILNVMNLIGQLGNNKNYASVIKQHSFQILAHLLTHITDPEIVNAIIAIANSWANTGLIDNEQLESIMDPSKAADYDENLTAGQIAHLINECKKSVNWVPYTPIDYRQPNISISSVDSQQITKLVDQCLEEVEKL